MIISTSIKKIQSYGILVEGSFILGCDFDNRESFDELADFIDETNLLMPWLNILRPYPGTKLYERLKKDGRIIDDDWCKYCGKNVVFTPALLTPEELKERHRHLIKKIYSFESIEKRLKYYLDIDFWKRFKRDRSYKL